LNRLLIMGPPGAGKGTQAVAIAERYEIPAISTGDLFRRNVVEGTALGETVRGYLAAGDYVPDSVTNAMVRSRVAMPDCARGFVLDGYPRTLAQVAALDQTLASVKRVLRAVIVLEVDPELLIERLVKRAEVEQRADDTEDIIRRRQKVYLQSTAPLVAEYASRRLLVRVDGRGTAPDVTERIFAKLDARV
jgi:adenylate kinase